MPVSVGTKLGPYEVVEPIGTGGMGEVWKARDTRLGRLVAIKQQKTPYSARFEKEARAIASLNHPHICTLYDIGPDYLVMEYVEGVPVQGPVPAREAIQLALQIVGALEAAHAKGIIHCDLKPANILLNAAGVKLLDFGLARLTAPPTDATRTLESSVAGTAAYMSPEQARGEQLDERSDVFSLGSVLYELVSGRRAFTGNSSMEILSAVLRDEPQAIEAPPKLDRVIRGCLRKQRAARFGSMAEVRDALGAAGHEAESAIHEQPSIAVLPFVNLSSDQEDEYFSDGLAEEILNALSQVEGLRVAARTSSFFFKGKTTEISEIAARLCVANVLEGSVRRADRRVRVTVQLVDVKNGFQLWSERYDRQMEDIFDVQDQIARAITERLKGTLGGGVKQSTTNVDAYELYLQGRHYWHQRSPATLRVAIGCFEQAIKLDPQYALAYAGLADCYGIIRGWGWMPVEAGKAPAKAAVTKAMTLAPSLWEVNFSRAVYQFYFERAWREAGPYFEKAIVINPRSSLAHAYYGLFLITEERAGDAIAQATLACELDPLSPFIHAFLALVCISAGRFADAERAARKALELQPDYLFGVWTLGLALSHLGHHEQAIEALERAAALSRAPVCVGALGMGYARAGRAGDTIRLLRELEDRGGRGEYVTAFALLFIYTAQGDLPAIRRALASWVDPLPPYFWTGFGLEPFRSDPEVHRLLSELYGR